MTNKPARIELAKHILRNTTAFEKDTGLQELWDSLESLFDTMHKKAQQVHPSHGIHVPQ